ncbi:hypothetical protein FIU28_17375 [Tardiphaga sp. vice154]|uniref:hypothetical protein n=1 Tax=Tardiphaga sp. vice154 TaxID=2592814 RepID=UPI0011623080|nr:hypothetical protein [Tardiphaga sp. vice154]QDM22723.1 hypothetical protein FIU28_17375 [Tardiphaga sp. vice154]
MPAVALPGGGGAALVAALVAAVVWWKANRGTTQTIGKWVAIIGAVIAIAAVGFYLSVLRERSTELADIKQQVVAAEDRLGCTERDREAERELFVCLPLQEAEAKQAAADELAKQQAAHDKTLGEQIARTVRAQADLAKSDKEADEDQDANNDIPAALGRYYDGKRAAMGLK